MELNHETLENTFPKKNLLDYMHWPPREGESSENCTLLTLQIKAQKQHPKSLRMSDQLTIGFLFMLLNLLENILMF